LDLRDGQAFVSLVAFNFQDTRVLGISWPGYRIFPELNFRTYVRHGDQRGVLFLREFVAQRVTCWMAWWLYNEPYRTAPLTYTLSETAEQLTAECRLRYAGKRHAFSVTGRKPAVCPAEDSLEHFFKEHRWGFGEDRKGRLIRYEVIHPPWDVYPVLGHHVDFDFAAAYGGEWSFLSAEQPYLVMLALGSEVEVFAKVGIVSPRPK
jgi:hypothetical protein